MTLHASLSRHRVPHVRRVAGGVDLVALSPWHSPAERQTGGPGLRSRGPGRPVVPNIKKKLRVNQGAVIKTR